MTTMPEPSEAVTLRIAAAAAFRLNPVQWIGGDGRTTHDVSRMEISHIQNCIRLIVEERIERAGTNGLNHGQWLTIFQDELVAREYAIQKRLHDLAASKGKPT